MDNKKIAERLVSLRGDKIQEEVSKVVGISKAAMAMYEIGERILRDNVKLKLAKYYNKSKNKYELPLFVENSYQVLADKFGVKHKTMSLRKKDCYRLKGRCL